MRRAASAFWPQRAARLAGALYLFVIVGGGIAELGVRQRVFVAGDPEATARNLLSRESLFRMGFAIDLAALLCVIPLIVLLYELLKVVNRSLALTALCFSLVGAAVQAAALLGQMSALVVLTRGTALGVDPATVRFSASMALQLQRVGFGAALAFFGGTMLTRGYLIATSRVLPRSIGILLMVEGVAYWVNSFVDFIAPRYASGALAALMVTALAEVALALWLLVKGVNVEAWQSAGSAA